MTCELAFPRGIDPARLDENRYLESLVEQGAAAGLFSPEAQEHLQNQAMGLLARQARKYTGGDTSLPRETAADLAQIPWAGGGGEYDALVDYLCASVS